MPEEVVKQDQWSACSYLKGKGIRVKTIQHHALRQKEKKRSNMLRELFGKTQQGEHEIEDKSKGNMKDKQKGRQNRR